jgi:hypothetical protein
MKKSMLIIFVGACVAMMASVVFAGTQFTSSSSTVLGSVVFTPSSNVVVNAKATDGTDTTNPNMYCVSAAHSSSINQSSGRGYAALSGGGSSAVNTNIVSVGLAGVTMSNLVCDTVTAWPSGVSGWQ